MSAFFQNLGECLSADFVVNALFAGVLVALATALLGVVLVLRRLSYIGDGLSHVAFGAMAVGTAVGLADDLALTVPVTAASAVLLLRSGRGTRLRGDAALAILSVTALAFGYLLMNLSPRSPNIAGDVCTTLFGSISIITLSARDVWLSGALSAAVVVFFALFRNRLFEVSFDADFAIACGTRTVFWESAVAVLSAIVIVLAMKLAGTLLVSALLVFPAVSAMRLRKSFQGVMLAAAVFSVVCALVGMLVAIAAGTPVGATIVAVDALAFAACSLR